MSSALPGVPRACGAVQVRLAFESRYAPLDSVLVAVRWADCVRPGASPQVGWGSELLSPRGSIFLSPDNAAAHPAGGARGAALRAGTERARALVAAAAAEAVKATSRSRFPPDGPKRASLVDVYQRCGISTHTTDRRLPVARGRTRLSECTAWTAKRCLTHTEHFRSASPVEACSRPMRDCYVWQFANNQLIRVRHCSTDIPGRMDTAPKRKVCR